MCVWWGFVGVCEPLKPCVTLAAALNCTVADKKRADASSLGCIRPPNWKYHWSGPNSITGHQLLHNRICVCFLDSVSEACVCYVCAGMRGCNLSVVGLRGKKDDPAQLTVSHAGQNNTITLLLTRTWHTSHLFPPPRSFRTTHRQAHAFRWRAVLMKHTHTDGHFNKKKSLSTHTCSRNVFKRHKGGFS